MSAAIAQLEDQLTRATDPQAVYELEQQLLETRAAERAAQNRARLRQEDEARERAKEHAAKVDALAAECRAASDAVQAAMDELARTEHARAVARRAVDDLRWKRSSAADRLLAAREQRASPSRPTELSPLDIEIDDAARAAHQAGMRGASVEEAIEAARRGDTDEKRHLDAAFAHMSRRAQ